MHPSVMLSVVVLCGVVVTISIVLMMTSTTDPHLAVTSRVRQCHSILTAFSNQQRRLIRRAHDGVKTLRVLSVEPLLPSTCTSPPPPPFHVNPWNDRTHITAAPFTPPSPPSPERFAGIHPAYPPARFLSALASGYWMPNFSYFALDTAPLLYSTHDFSQRNVRAANATALAHSSLKIDDAECVPLSDDGSSECAAMHYYTAEQACWILSHFTVLHIHGDSLARQMWMGLLQIVTDNFADGHVNKWPNGPTINDCQYDAAYMEKPCRRGLARDMALTAAHICPAIASVLLPWDNTLNVTTLNETAYSKLIGGDATSNDEPCIDSLLRGYYTPLPRIDDEGTHPTAAEQRLPPVRTPSERLSTQAEALRHGYSASRHQYLHLPLPLSKHIGAVVVMGTGLHDYWGGRWPGALHDYLLNMSRLYVQKDPSIGQVFPLIVPIHQMSTWHQSRSMERSAYTDTHSVGATMSRYAQTLVDPHRFYRAESLFLHHYAHQHAAHVNFSTVPEPPPPPSDWNDVTSNGLQCLLRPYNVLDFVSLTTQLPANFSYDGLHYTQRVNVVKAYALLNYLHTIVQQHTLIHRIT